MGLFGTTSDAGISEEVETATSEKNVEEDWSSIINICDKAGKSPEDAKAYLKAITKRLYHTDPHVGVKAVTLLDACVKNSGKTFHVEIASRDFESDFIKLMTKAPPSVAKKLRESLRKWAENEFKADTHLNLIPTLLSKLKSTGYDFSLSESPIKKAAPLSKDPNVVETQEEEEQILKAIELSLKESGSPRSAAKTSSSNSQSLYPTINSMTASSAPSAATPSKEPRKVRALYDFEAAEDNELTFNTGEIIFLIDDSDTNWWKGSNQRGEGLFPANFVTADLAVEPEKFLFEKAKKMVQFKETADVQVVKEEPENVEINEQKINRLLHLLHEADPTNPDKDTEEMLKLEREVNAMGPLIDAELEQVDRKHAQLTQLSTDLVEALGLYHTLMREPTFPSVNKMPFGFPPASSQMPYNGTIHPNFHYPMMQQAPQGPERPPFIQVPPNLQQHSMMPQHFQHPPPPGIPTPLPLPRMQQHIQAPPQSGYPMIQDEEIMENLQYGQGLLNYGSGNIPPTTFVPPPSGPTSQTNIQNTPQQTSGVNYVPSSTHMTQ